MNGLTIEALGDSAICVQVDGPPLAANGRIHRLAAAVRDASLRAVRDVVPGMSALVVHVDPRHADIERLESVIHAAAAMVPGHAAAGRPGDAGSGIVEIPVTYGGAVGVDLDEVASACGMDAADVCRRHAQAEYVVCFTGFLPGFPYLGLLDPSLRLPRRATPRSRVPAGAVAIAGEYSGIYPTASPGGWHLIGHTAVSLFDLDADPPARLAPGMRVRFVPITHAEHDP